MQEKQLKNCIKIENKNLTEEERKRNLSRLYDVINKIAATLPASETANWFMTEEKLEEMKKSGKYKFI